MAGKRFQTKITRSRTILSGLKPEDMKYLGDQLRDKIVGRIKAAKTVYDTDAKPLSEKYLKSPTGKHYYNHPAVIRDLQRSGRMLRSIKTLRADHNKAVIGFTDPFMALRMKFNIRRSDQWGISPSDHEYILGEVRERWLLRKQLGRYRKAA